jgi:hypothetical protein
VEEIRQSDNEQSVITISQQFLQIRQSDNEQPVITISQQFLPPVSQAPAPVVLLLWNPPPATTKPTSAAILSQILDL